ncbi:MAG: calcium/sodium antiporter [Acetobacteraceae bacterium]|nr:calcium/sodium antiporter [Acetobacteraceae bacterium]
MAMWVSLLGGLALLVAGGELLVCGAVRLAERMGVSPLVIGLTLVGFGTSMPELVASVQASLAGSPGIAVGNVVGSNIANLLLVLGVSALLCPIVVGSRALQRDGVVVLGTAVAFALVGLMMALDRLVGAVFLAGLVGYIVYAWRQERLGTAGHTAAYDVAEAFAAAHGGVPAPGGTGRLAVVLSAGMVVAGLGLVVAGGGLLVDGAIALARTLGVSDSVIGLTVVALGTSMPEMVTSIMAAIRRQADVALGNILGSNIYNVLGIAGATGLIAPTVIPEGMVWFDNLVMVAVSAVALLFAWTSRRIGRREGATLLAGYGVYLAVIWPA